MSDSVYDTTVMMDSSTTIHNHHHDTPPSSGRTHRPPSRRSTTIVRRRKRSLLLLLWWRRLHRSTFDTSIQLPVAVDLVFIFVFMVVQNIIVMTIYALLVLQSIDGFVVVPNYPHQQHPQQQPPPTIVPSNTASSISLRRINNGGITPPSTSRIRIQITNTVNSQDTITSTTHSRTTLTSSTTTTTTTTPIGWEDWCIQQLQLRYNEALRIKCPFFRRRASDLLDGLDMILQFLLVRHKSISLLDFTRTTSTTTTTTPPTTTSRLASTITTASTGSSSSSSSSSTITNTNSNSNRNTYIQHSSTIAQSTETEKLYNLSIEEMLAIIIEDWKVTNHKGYYVTGKLSTCIYHDDTLFDGPDPDMPVKGLYKYINAASQLFDTKHTFCELLSIETQPEQVLADTNTNSNQIIIVAKWKMHGRLRLPWKPVVPEWTGTTRYYRHPHTGLIHQHIETWDISVLQAFVQTLFPTTMTKHMFQDRPKKLHL